MRRVFGIYALSLLLSIAAVAKTDNKTLAPVDYINGMLKDYSAEEIKLIQDDFHNIEQLCFRGLTASNNKHYVATAGGPGASKSTILETYLHDEAPTYAYLDPDQRALKFMINTYLQELTVYKISKAPDFQALLQSAYNKWRAGSNYIATSLLNKAFAAGYNIAHGTTSTSEHVGKIYETLHENGYKITLLLCYATDNNRVKALEHRAKNQGFCQVDPEDVVKKGKMFPERFPTYFQYADEILLYWINDFKKGAVLAATLKKGQKMVVHDATALRKFKKQYNQDRKGKKLPSFESLEKQYSGSKVK